jgi:tetratricopeptide (TPR) repeat protein
MRKSIDCFEAALRLDPGLAAAHDGICDAHTMLACRGMAPAVESFHRAKAAAREAIRMDPELGEGHASLAHVRLHDWDWVGLEREFERAVGLNPGYAIAHYWYAEYLMAMGRTEQAVARVQHAWGLDPLNSVINASVGMIRYLAHDYDGALSALQRGLEIDPTHYVSHLRAGSRACRRGLRARECGQCNGRWSSPAGARRRWPGLPNLWSEEKLQQLAQRVGWSRLRR